MRRIRTQIPLSEDERGHLIAELNYWQNRSYDFYGNRTKEENAFLQYWKGQNASGVKIDKGEELAWPFEGASDQRVRWGDTAFQDFLSLVIVALDGCKVEVTCDGTAQGQKRAAAISKVVKWCRRKLGAKWYTQIAALMRYMMVDTPAIAAMDVEWSVKRTLGLSVLEFDKLQVEYQVWRVNQTNDISPEDAAAEFATVIGMGEESEGYDLMRTFLAEVKGVPEDDIDDVLEALDEEKECECLAAATKWEGPDIKALRFGDDFMIPESCEDFDYADPLFRSEWYTETQLRELAAEGEWDEEWVEETLKTKGATFYDKRDYRNSDDMKNVVNVVWFYTTDTTPSGDTVRYETLLSLANGSAFGKRVVRSRRGKWDTIFFRREVLANNLTASRGLAHICAPDQGLAKEIKDGANNNAIVSSLPAIKAKGARVRNVMIEPFGVINMGQSDDVSWMQPPPYPATAKEMVKEIKDDLLAFLGISNGETDVSIRNKGWSAFILAQFRELYVKLVECAQDYASDEALLTVTNSTDLSGVRHEDLDGDFQLSLEFDPANLDHEDLIKRANAVAQVIAPLDSKNEIDRGPLVRETMLALFPNIAEASFRSSEELTADDISDEQNNFVKIKAGIQPPVNTEGKWNYQARLEFYQRLQQENPEAIQDMSEVSQQIFQRHIQALEQQALQYGENAAIGRTGVAGVISE